MIVINLSPTAGANNPVSLPPSLLAIYQSTLDSLKPPPMAGTRGLDAKNRIKWPRATRDKKDEGDLRNELFMSKSQVNELVQEKKILQAKLIGMEKSHNLIEKRYQDHLMFKYIMDQKPNKNGRTRSLSTLAPVEDKVVSNLRSALKMAEEKIKQRDDEIEGLKKSTKYRKIQEYETEVTAYYMETLKLKRMLEHQGAGTATLNEDPDQLLKYDDALAEYRRKLDRPLDNAFGVEVSEKLRDERDRYRAIIDSLQSELEELGSSHVSLQTEHERLSAEHEITTNELKDTSDALDTMRDLRDKAQEEIEDHIRTQADMDNHRRGLEAERDEVSRSLFNEKVTNAGMLAQAQSQIEELKTIRDDLQACSDTLHRQISDVTRERDDAVAEHRRQEKQNEILTIRIEGLQRDKDAVVEEVVGLREERRRIKDELAEAREATVKAETRLEGMGDQLKLKALVEKCQKYVAAYNDEHQRAIQKDAQVDLLAEQLSQLRQGGAQSRGISNFMPPKEVYLSSSSMTYDSSTRSSAYLTSTQTSSDDPTTSLDVSSTDPRSSNIESSALATSTGDASSSMPESTEATSSIAPGDAFGITRELTMPSGDTGGQMYAQQNYAPPAFITQMSYSQQPLDGMSYMAPRQSTDQPPQIIMMPPPLESTVPTTYTDGTATTETDTAGATDTTPTSAPADTRGLPTTTSVTFSSSSVFSRTCSLCDLTSEPSSDATNPYPPMRKFNSETALVMPPPSQTRHEGRGRRRARRKRDGSRGRGSGSRSVSRSSPRPNGAQVVVVRARSGSAGVGGRSSIGGSRNGSAGGDPGLPPRSGSIRRSVAGDGGARANSVEASRGIQHSQPAIPTGAMPTGATEGTPTDTSYQTPLTATDTYSGTYTGTGTDTYTGTGTSTVTPTTATGARDLDAAHPVAPPSTITDDEDCSCTTTSEAPSTSYITTSSGPLSRGILSPLRAPGAAGASLTSRDDEETPSSPVLTTTQSHHDVAATESDPHTTAEAASGEERGLPSSSSQDGSCSCSDGPSTTTGPNDTATDAGMDAGVAALPRFTAEGRASKRSLVIVGGVLGEPAAADGVAAEGRASTRSQVIVGGVLGEPAAASGVATPKRVSLQSKAEIKAPRDLEEAGQIGREENEDVEGSPPISPSGSGYTRSERSLSPARLVLGEPAVSEGASGLSSPASIGVDDVELEEVAAGESFVLDQSSIRSGSTKRSVAKDLWEEL
ncbi:hypothetical protein HK101_010400 [Irineochytrium annulatum]|nr:hypothetical protein HK101_010400 [Irineochytrium annulatum]